MSSERCSLCYPAATQIFHLGEGVVGLWPDEPESTGHAVLVTKRHVASWFDATEEEQREALAAVAVARAAIDATHGAPDGFTLRVNVGSAAGQTVPHLAVDVVPRWGDGGTGGDRGHPRSIPPGFVSADQTAAPVGGSLTGALFASLPHDAPLVAGDQDDPLLPHLIGHISAAAEVDLAVAFVLPSGLSRLRPHLQELLERGGRVRVLTGDYLDVTDPGALRVLLDLADEARSVHSHAAPRLGVRREGMALRIFDASAQAFHPKAYIFRSPDGSGVAYVGSSNLSKTALEAGVEWNYRVVPSADLRGFRSVEEGFERLFAHPRTSELSEAWVRAYEARRRPTDAPRVVDTPVEVPESPPPPHDVQKEALAALSETRADGYRAGLVVLATGLGKTWLAAYDTASSPEFRRVLFVAHREEILGQARDTFRRIRPNASLGLYAGGEKTPDAEVVFASVQTLGRKRHLERFDEGTFDYVIVDEFHHAAARTYRRILDHFEPRFLLGLTATPERTDGGDLLGLCGENVVYSCDLSRGIRLGLLSPFRYFGVPDTVDYANIPWRSSRFDPTELESALATEARAENAFEQWGAKAGRASRTLAFCCSQRHADYMAQYFAERDVRVASVHAGSTSAPRAESLERLEAADLDVVFAVDMFNEGVDVPHIDAVLMLRPTESRILWLQQFGRGLRKAEGKRRFTVVDYIGNHRVFLNKPKALLGLSGGDAAVAHALDQIQGGEFELPPGCEVKYDLESIDLLRGLLRLPKHEEAEALRDWYREFSERTGQRPRALEAFHEGYNPRAARKRYGSWLSLVAKEGGFTPEQAVLLDGQTGAFLEQLEKTQMTKSFKMVVLLALLNEDALPGEIPIDRLVAGFARVAGRNAKLRGEVEVSLEDPRQLQSYLERNPINAWIGGRGTGGESFFAYEDGRFRSTFSVPQEARIDFQEVVRELAEWRLGEYLARSPEPTEGRFRAKVRHSGGRPILFLPDRDTVPGLPEGTMCLDVDGTPHEADFVKVAVNVMRELGGSENVLPAVMRRWFGADAGLPGTRFEVEFERSQDGQLRMKPVGVSSQRLELWKSYAREEIPGKVGLSIAGRTLHNGVVSSGDVYLLFVTLEKKDKPDAHQYEDRFLAPDLFQWQSQNRTPRNGKVARELRDPGQYGKQVHLFVRKTSKVGGATAPFVYCGQPGFVDWEGEKPITFRWRIEPAVPGFLWERLGVQGE